ncbi:MAG: DUF4158 domain-containing protein [Candidatus Competibacteraceae bacterium]
MQPSDTAYPRFKSRPSSAELERFYTPCENERVFCDSHTRSQTTRLGFVRLLKTYQRLGYFVTSEQVPGAIVEHVAAAVNESGDREALRQYDLSQARRKHVPAVREFLEVKPVDAGGKALMREAFRDAALTKEDVADLINIGIETLVRDRYELPAFDTLEREARAQRAATHQELFAQVNSALGDADRSLFDSLFVVGDNQRRVSPWNDLKQDSAKPTLDGMRQLVGRYDQLTGMAGHAHVLKAIPLVKIRQWALEGGSLDAASMADLEPNKRYAVTLALISQRLARVTDDLCDIFCKQMRRVTRLAEAALEKYLTNNQEKTDEILRRYATLETLLNSDCPEAEQLQAVRHTVTARPDLCEFSRLHAEHGGKNERRFRWHFFKHRRSELLRILGKIKPVSTSQDASFERSLAFMLGLRRRHGEWVELKPGNDNGLSLADLEWMPYQWRKLVIGEGQPGTNPTRLNRRQFEVCVCSQTVRELKSGDLCVVGGGEYSDFRDEWLPMGECEKTRADYGEKVGLPVESRAFVKQVRTMVTEAAAKADETYHDNPYFKMINGRPKLSKQAKKPAPPGFSQLDKRLTAKLDALDLSLLDVLTDTMQWLGWGEHCGPLNGHQGKLKEDAKRKILTAFAYGTGLGPTQIAKNVTDLSARQVSFVNQRQVTTEKLESAIGTVINAYNRFRLPHYWGDTKRAAADGTQWNLYGNYSDPPLLVAKIAHRVYL